MNAPILPSARWHLWKLQLPVAVLFLLLQRTPAARLLPWFESIIASASRGAILQPAALAFGALGAVHSLAGATALVSTVASPASFTVGQEITPVGFTVTNTVSIAVWRLGGNLPPGLRLSAFGSSIEISAPGDLNATTPGEDDGYGGTTGGTANTVPLLVGTPTQAGSFTITLQAMQGPLGYSTATFNYAINVAASNQPANPPTFATQPTNQTVAAGGSAVLSAAAAGTAAFQWQRNGTAISGASNSSYTVANLQPADAGLYSAVITSGGNSSTSNPAIVGLNSSVKLVGPGREFPDIFHPGTQFTYDQVLLEGASASVKADSDLGQILRISFIDLNDDIVQVEFSGPGTLTLVLDNPSGPAAPAKYNQSGVSYMKGHAGIILTGATRDTNLTVFSVGRAIPGSNPALYSDSITYDGFADIAFIAISSTDGQFAGLRAANANCFATRGFTGVYAPGVQFNGPVFVNDINASDDATPVYRIGGGSDVRITGGDLQQANGRPVQVSGIAQLRFTAGSNSHGTLFAARSNQGVLMQDGANVTSQIVVNP